MDVFFLSFFYFLLFGIYKRNWWFHQKLENSVLVNQGGAVSHLSQKENKSTALVS